MTIKKISMNIRLIFRLSLFGLAMALATVFWIPSSSEPFYWLLIFVFCAYLISLKSSGKYFMSGFWVSIANCVWITTVHILFFHTYMANHPQEADMLTKMPLPDSPRLMMLITGPVIGIISGLVLGLFAFLASKIMQKK
jgi:amino acid permease